MVRLTDQVEITGRNARMGESSEAYYLARFDWIWGYDVERATADA